MIHLQIIPHLKITYSITLIAFPFKLPDLRQKH